MNLFSRSVQEEVNDVASTSSLASNDSFVLVNDEKNISSPPTPPVLEAVNFVVKASPPEEEVSEDQNPQAEEAKEQSSSHVAVMIPVLEHALNNTDKSLGMIREINHLTRIKDIHEKLRNVYNERETLLQNDIILLEQKQKFELMSLQNLLLDLRKQRDELKFDNTVLKKLLDEKESADYVADNSIKYIRLWMRELSNFSEPQLQLEALEKIIDLLNYGNVINNETYVQDFINESLLEVVGLVISRSPDLDVIQYALNVSDVS